MAILASLSLAEREFGPQLALLVVAAAGAENVPQFSLGDLRVGGGGRDHQHAVVGIDFGGRDRHAGVEVADYQLDAVADELVRDRNALLGIGNVVALFDCDFLAVDATGLVEVLRSLSDALHQLRAERGVRPCDRTGDPDLDLGARGAREGQPRGEQQARQQVFFHTTLPKFRGATGAPAERHPTLVGDKACFRSRVTLKAGNNCQFFSFSYRARQFSPAFSNAQEYCVDI